jgi:hypothetical protein
MQRNPFIGIVLKMFPAKIVLQKLDPAKISKNI